MNAFISWSGGKDCMLALYLASKNNLIHKDVILLNMCDKTGKMSRSHGLSSNILEAQAECMVAELLQQPIGENGYEDSFKNAISTLKSQGIQYGVFGDIYLESHREWIERVCNDIEIKPLFPLWGMTSQEVVEKLIEEGFKCKIVSVRKEMLDATWLGTNLTHESLTKLCSLKGIDPCGEHGEYHTLVWDGPLFSAPLQINEEGIIETSKHYMLNISIQAHGQKSLQKEGLTHIYTGNGKGKTTAAVGLATRALGSGLKVCFCSFLKRPSKFGYSEMASLKKLGATIFIFTPGHPHRDKKREEHVVIEELKNSLDFLEHYLKQHSIDLLILDEILIAVRDSYISEAEVLNLIKNKPANMELILTGRGATKTLIEAADYVTNMEKIKHPFDKKIKSRKGIEY